MLLLKEGEKKKKRKGKKNRQAKDKGRASATTRPPRAPEEKKKQMTNASRTQRRWYVHNGSPARPIGGAGSSDVTQPLIPKGGCHDDRLTSSCTPLRRLMGSRVSVDVTVGSPPPFPPAANKVRPMGKGSSDVTGPLFISAGGQ